MIVLTACNRSAPVGGEALLWVQPMRDHPVHKLMQAGFLDRCRELKVHCDVVGNPSATAFDIAATIPLADAALARRRHSAVMVYAVDPALNPYVARLARDGYPVMIVHLLPAPDEIPGLKAAIGQDIRTTAADAAVAMGTRLRGQGAIAVTQGSYNRTENEMAQVFAATLAKCFPQIRLLAPQLEGFEPTAARARALGILQSNPQLAGAFSTTGAGAETWANASRTASRSVTIIGMSAVRQNLDLIKSGAVYAIAAQPLYEESAAAVDIGLKLARGEQVEFRNVIPTAIVTAADVAPYYALLEKAGQ
ncbi:MAG: substrate-binding domain-containing protein [Phycisphaerae bacterium]|nr:substrate-binding domain-containing protein [Phycisphaerae bacterium]MDZ4780268.1 substrate-binding domain-containing protein [Planctomycetia bacterium]